MLALLLLHDLTTLGTAPHVLDIYSHVRQPLSTEVVWRLCLIGGYTSLRGLIGLDVSSSRLLGIMKQIQSLME